MKRYLSLLILLWTSVMSFAQSISVARFKLLDSDLTANTAGTMEQDQNGETAALIKVVSTQTGFSFDCGSMGVVKTLQKPSEIWVYVPRGVKKMTISHPQLGLLRDYFFPISVDAARTYEMVLVSGEVQTVVKRARTSQYVVFKLNPSDAVVEIHGELLKTENGIATKLLNFGSYNYKVLAQNYLPESGNLVINDSENKHFVEISLKPNFSLVNLKVDNEAEIWVNGEEKGMGFWSGNLGAGVYEFETRKQGYKSVSLTQEIVVSSEPQTIQLQTPIPIYGDANITSSPAMADVFIDEVKVGQTPLMLSNVIIGEHRCRISLHGYSDFITSLSITEGELSDIKVSLQKMSDSKPGKYVVGYNPAPKLSFNVDNASFDMILVEGGTFVLGESKFSKNKCQVTLSSYYIGETEVTQDLWKAVMGSNPSKFKGALHPVERVSWNDCQKFIRKLNEKTGLNFRLPTEAEWEFAARGGVKSRDYEYSGTNVIYDYWFNENSNEQTHMVKTKVPNELGIHDMSGNVCEFVQDYWEPHYRSSPQTNPTGPTSGSNRVIRGGSWSDDFYRGTVVFRGHDTPRYKANNTGLRLAL